MRRRTILGLGVIITILTSFAAPAAGPSGYEFITMPDGVKIAVSVTIPEGCSASSKCSAIFEMSGYDGGGASADDRGTMCGDSEFNCGTLEDDSRQLTRHFDDKSENGAGDYVIVHASVRGSGCSGGEFDLFSWTSALDGKYIIDSWIAKQPWSNGKVGIIGHSYGGLTGTLVAATRPDHLEVISVSGLIDDLYRGITYPGGVSNMGFPPLWTIGVRSAYDVGGGLFPRLIRPIKDGYPEQTPECIQAASTKSRSIFNDPVIQGGLGRYDNGWFQQRSLVNHVSKITVPVHIVGAYQDEQTGARGPAHVWEKVLSPKRLVLSNGDHGTAGLYPNTHIRKDRVDWLNKYLYGTDLSAGLSNPKVDPANPVRVYLESRNTGDPNGIIDAEGFPLPETVWKDHYFADGAKLVATPPSGGSARYISGSPRHGWFTAFGPEQGQPLTTADGPDALHFSMDIAQDTTVVGPINAHLDLSSTAVDTELYVEIIDEDPVTHTRAYLQRGVLRASHRAIHPSESDCVDVSNAHAPCDAPGARLYRPFRPHAQSQLLTPNERYDLLVEVWPLGHVFRAGHKLHVLVTTPPILDNYYAYVPERPVGINTLHFGPDSRITLPVIEGASFVKPLGAARPCAQQDSLRCISQY